MPGGGGGGGKLVTKVATLWLEEIEGFPDEYRAGDWSWKTVN